MFLQSNVWSVHEADNLTTTLKIAFAVNSTIFWDMMPCNLVEIYQYFKGM
jgi:hypothetical protein